MSLHAYEYNLTFKAVNCCECKAVFMMTETAIINFQKSKTSFHCCYCGAKQGWFGENEEEKLKRQLKLKEDANNFLRKQNEKERNRTRAQKAAKTRIKNRIANGVCPCCNRTFANLAKHMHHMHPDYKKES